MHTLQISSQQPTLQLNAPVSMSIPSTSTSTSTSILTLPSPSLSPSSISALHSPSLVLERRPPLPIIQNVISRVLLGQSFDDDAMRKIALRARNAQYNPKKTHAVVIRRRESSFFDTTAMLYKSGKIKCLGAKSEEGSRLACRKYARIIQKLDHPGITFRDFQIVNVMASTEVHFHVHLQGIANHPEHEQQCSYEPETFAKVDYRLDNPKVTINIFANGKLVFLGAKSVADIRSAVNKIFPILCQFENRNATKKS